MNAQQLYHQLIQQVEGRLQPELRPLFQLLLPGIQGSLVAMIESRLTLAAQRSSQAAAQTAAAQTAATQTVEVGSSVLDSAWRPRVEPHSIRFEAPCSQERGGFRPKEPCSTPWAGVSGKELQPEALVPEARVVTRDGLHGTLQRVETLNGTDAPGLDTGQRQSPWRNVPGFKPFPMVFYHVQLDSGRTVRITRPLYEEYEKPGRVIPDIRMDERWLTPPDAWGWLVFLYDSVSRLKLQAEQAVTAAHRTAMQQEHQQVRQQYLQALQRWAEWYVHQYPLELVNSYPARQLKAGLFRRMQLELGAPERFPQELAYLKGVTAFYHEQLRPGVRVKAWVWESGIWQEVEDELKAFAQPDLAVLKSQRQTPVYYLRLLPSNRRPFVGFV